MRVKYFQITSLLDNHSTNRWTLAGNFRILSSTVVTLGGGSPPTPNFIGCMRNAEFTADSLKLNLIELSRRNGGIVGLVGRARNDLCAEIKNNQVSFSNGLNES